jgi:hypothetical protein
MLSQLTAPAGQAATGLTAADIQRLEQNANQRVIVILRNQHKELIGAASKAARASAIQADQAGVVQELHTVHAPRVQAFHLINAVATTVSQAEAQHLRGNASVQAVVPDVPVPLSKPVVQASPGYPPGSDQPISNLCSTNKSAPLLEPEALQVTNTVQAQSLATGAGVTVAFIADGIDIHNPDFIRPNGQSVFTDYQDFNGDGPNAPSDAREAFGDASSVAAQGR